MKVSSSKRNIVGPNVHRIREKKIPSMTQERLAAELQMLGWDADRFIISKIERGERQVTDKEVILLSIALGIDAAQLLKT